MKASSARADAPVVTTSSATITVAAPSSVPRATSRVGRRPWSMATLASPDPTTRARADAKKRTAKKFFEGL